MNEKEIINHQILHFCQRQIFQGFLSLKKFLYCFGFYFCQHQQQNITRSNNLCNTKSMQYETTPCHAMQCNVHVYTYIIVCIMIIKKSKRSQKKQESSRKTSTSALFTMPKPLIVNINKLWEILKRYGNIRPPHLSPEKFICRSRSNTQNWAWNRLLPNQERSALRLYIVTLLI